MLKAFGIGKEGGTKPVRVSREDRKYMKRGEVVYSKRLPVSGPSLVADRMIYVILAGSEEEADPIILEFLNHPSRR